MSEFMQRLLSCVPAPGFAREYQEIERAMVEVSKLVPGPYPLIQQICREVASHYPAPARQTLKWLTTELSTGQSTELVQDFWREYGNVKAKERA